MEFKEQYRIKNMQSFVKIFVMIDGTVKYKFVDSPKTFKSLEDFKEKFTEKFKKEPILIKL